MVFAGRTRHVEFDPPIVEACRYRVAGALIVIVVPVAAQYKLTVNGDRLVNAHNEPQNWLLMNGDYASTRYSKLTQINRDNVKTAFS